MNTDQIFQFILNDDLPKAELSLRNNQEKDLELVATLLDKVKHKPPPLKSLRSRLPKLYVISTAYTCSMKCKMCLSRFQEIPMQGKDKHLTPEKFDELRPWIEAGSMTSFAGAGETMDTPYLFDFLEKLKDKPTVLVTSGMTLNEHSMRKLIENRLNFLHLSFDGKTSLGHGAGKDSYIENFWEKVQRIQHIKKELKNEYPNICLRVTMDRENLDNFDEMAEMALEYGVHEIIIALMSPYTEKLFDKSLFVDFDAHKKKLNEKITKWRKKGANIRVSLRNKLLYDHNRVCPSVDNILNFVFQMDHPVICCTSFTTPTAVGDYSINKYWNAFPFRYFRFLHFCSEPEALPRLCQICWVENPKKFSEEGLEQTMFKNQGEAVRFYNEGSKLKKNNKLKESKKLFRRVLEQKPDYSFTGQTYFHLGEIKVIEKKYSEALSLMKLAVQYCFHHKKAFVYLYLLYMLTEDEPEEFKRKKKVYLKWLHMKSC